MKDKVASNAPWYTWGHFFRFSLPRKTEKSACWWPAPQSPGQVRCAPLPKRPCGAAARPVDALSGINRYFRAYRQKAAVRSGHKSDYISGMGKDTDYPKRGDKPGANR